MTTAALKKEIKKAIESIDDNRLLEAVYVIVNANQQRNDYQLSKEDIKIIEERKAAYKSGKAKMYSSKEVSEKIRKNLKK